MTIPVGLVLLGGCGGAPDVRRCLSAPADEALTLFVDGSGRPCPLDRDGTELWVELDGQTEVAYRLRGVPVRQLSSEEYDPEDLLVGVEGSVVAIPVAAMLWEVPLASVSGRERVSVTLEALDEAGAVRSEHPVLL